MKKMIVRHRKEEPKGTIGVLQILLSFDIPLRIRYFVTNVLSVVWGEEERERETQSSQDAVNGRLLCPNFP